MNLPQAIWNLSKHEITDAQRDAAIKTTGDLLVAIDIKRIDMLRQRLELPPECLGFLAEIYASALIAATSIDGREILAMSSGKLVPPNVRTTIKGQVKIPFRPDRLVVSHAGTSAGAADWVINEIRKDGESITSGDIPGDMFATNALEGRVTWSECTKGMEIDITYIGDRPDGCPFFGAVVGSATRPASAKSPER